MEEYNPRAENQLNSILVARTEPCIALYPSANKNGSWIMYSLVTKSYASQTQRRKMEISEMVIM